MEPTKKRIDIIKEKCEANGLQIHKVFRIAGVSASTIRNWTYSEPQAFQIEEKINQTIELLIAEGENEGTHLDIDNPACFDPDVKILNVTAIPPRRR